MILKLIWRKRHDFAKCQVASWRSFGLQLSYYQGVTPNWEYCTSRCQHPSLYRVDAAQCIWLEIISLIYTFYKIPSLFAMGKMIDLNYLLKGINVISLHFLIVIPIALILYHCFRMNDLYFNTWIFKGPISFSFAGNQVARYRATKLKM